MNGEPRYGGFWLRGCALLVDAALLALLVWLLRLAAGWGYEQALSGTVLDARGETFAYYTALHTLGRDLIGLAVPLAYFTALEAAGATLGKRLAGLRVTGADGRSPGLFRTLLRNLAKPLGFALCCGGLLLAAWSARRRALHDWIAGTWVVRLDRPRRGPIPPPLPAAGG